MDERDGAQMVDATSKRRQKQRTTGEISESRRRVQESFLQRHQLNGTASLPAQVL
jgi:hypothetical protein